MSYTRTTWSDGSTALSAEHLNNIEDGIEELQDQKVDKAAGEGLYPDTDKAKLAGIAAGAEVNQNAFANVKVGSTTIAADSKTDTIEFVAGSNVTLTPDETNDKVTITSTNTNTWRGIQNNLTSTSTTDSLSAYQGKVLNDGKAAKSDAIKNITRSGTTFTATKADGTTFTFTQQDNNTTYTPATTSAQGLMSAADKTKLNGIATGAKSVMVRSYDLEKGTGGTHILTPGGYDTISCAVGVSGYTPLGIVGFTLSGTNNSYLNVYRCFVSGTTGYLVLRNNTTSGNVEVHGYMYVLYRSA